MGKLTDSLLSGSSGRVGRLVIANVAGTEIVRVRPKKRSTSASEAQILVQNRMKKTYQFIVPYKAYALQYFGTPLGMRSRYNQAITAILNAYKIDFQALTMTLEYSEIEFSRGNLLGAIPTGLTAPAPLSIKLDWINNAGMAPERAMDDLQFLMIAEGDDIPIFLESVTTRDQETWTQSVPPHYQGKTVHVWMAFRSTDLKEVSVSSYAGSIAIV